MSSCLSCIAVSPPAISVNISRSGSLVAGSEYNLTCVVSELIAGLTEMPSAVWERFAGVQISSEVVLESSRTDGMAIAVLRFNPLKTSFSGGYICRGALVSASKQTPLEETARNDVTVQSNYVNKFQSSIIIKYVCVCLLL